MSKFATRKQIEAEVAKQGAELVRLDTRRGAISVKVNGVTRICYGGAKVLASDVSTSVRAAIEFGRRI